MSSLSRIADALESLVISSIRIAAAGERIATVLEFRLPFYQAPNIFTPTFPTQNPSPYPSYIPNGTIPYSPYTNPTVFYGPTAIPIQEPQNRTVSGYTPETAYPTDYAESMNPLDIPF